MTFSDARMSTFVFLKDRVASVLTPAGCGFDIYMHGSYAKGTQVDPHGDIDIVVELCHPIVSEWRRGLSGPEYSWFRDAVAEGLSNDLEMISPGLSSMVMWGKNRSVLKVAPVLPGHVNVDLLVCQRYLESSPVSMNTAGQGVIFWNGYGVQVSHPKKYIAKFGEKDQRTDGMFKKLVRHLKENHVDIKYRGPATRRSTIPGQSIPMDSSIGVSSATLEMVAYGVPDVYYSSRSLNKTRKKVGSYLRGVAETERRRQSFVPWDLVNDTTYRQWMEFMHGGFRMMLSNERMWT
ncbi:hypothetical protein [Amycolatopsis plumensis]|uniref:Nucleotidyltransferase n=1 Tax=Amycolatopsis plumensis TaxID=236508 RepID=A0ABV5U4W5_9PSEU